MFLLTYVCSNSIMNKEDVLIKRIVARNIRKYRTKSNLTQEKVAELADLSLNFYQRLELVSQKDTPSLATLFKIAKVLRIKAAQLIVENRS